MRQRLGSFWMLERGEITPCETQWFSAIYKGYRDPITPPEEGPILAWNQNFCQRSLNSEKKTGGWLDGFLFKFYSLKKVDRNHPPTMTLYNVSNNSLFFIISTNLRQGLYLVKKTFWLTNFSTAFRKPFFTHVFIVGRIEHINWCIFT